MKSIKRILPISQVAAAVTLALAAQAAMAADHDVYLRACEYTKSLPTVDAAGAPTTTPVVMWGYEMYDTATAAAAATGCSVSAPPVIRVPAGSDNLNVHLYNALPAHKGVPSETSVYIPGQPKALSPELWVGGEYDGRIRSFDTEVTSGENGTYTWPTPRVGTFLLHSGTHPQVQVQMGLYAAVVINAVDPIVGTNPNNSTPAEVYPGIQPALEATLIYSEVDPAVHDSVAGNVYGPGGSMTSTIDYAPRWFLINGEPYSATGAHHVIAPAGNPGLRRGDSVFLRMVNAGIESHAMQILGGDIEVVAEDAHLKAAPVPSSSALLAAGKTLDAVFVAPAQGDFPLYDRSLRLVNDTDANHPGGIFASIHIQSGGAYQSPPKAAPDYLYITDGGALDTLATNWSATFAAPGILSNDVITQPGATTLVVWRVVGYPVIPNNNLASATLVNDPDGAPGAQARVRQNGRIDFRAASAGWIGVGAFDYQATDTTLTASAPAAARVVRDQYVGTAEFHTTNVPTGWNLAGVLRTSPTGDVSISMAPKAGGGPACVVANNTPIGTATPTGASWTYTGAAATPTNCNRIRVTASLPAADGVPAHSSSVIVPFTIVP